MTSSHHASAPSAAGIWTGTRMDFRHAVRLLWKDIRITATTLVTLALCIGVTTAIFSSVYALMLKPLPYQEPEGIVELYSSAVKNGLNHMPANVPFYLDYSKNATSYEELALWTFFYSLVGEKDSVARTPGIRATAEIFSILRLRPVLGTFFTKEQNKQGADKVIVLAQSYWQTQYQESPEVLGKEVRIDDEAYQIIGVAPRELEAFDARMKFIVPLSWPPAAENPQGRYGVGIQLFGRLKAGVTASQADAEAKVMEKRYVDAGPPPLKEFVERSGITMNVGGVQEQRVQPVRAILLMLQGGVVFVLLIGCVNVANLLLVRSNARQSELAVRSALGAARSTIARQFLVESLLLTSLGTLLGVGLAAGVLRVTNYYLAKMLPQSLPAALDWRVLGFAVALTVVVGLLIGLIPVFHILRTNLAAVIQSNSRGSSSSRGVRALSSALVVAQVAVALVLLTGAGLLIYSFSEAVKVDTGLDAANVVTARIALTREHRASDEAANSIRERLLQGMKEIPGVTSAALSISTPFQGGLPINAFTLENDTLPPGSPQPGAYRVIVTPGYAETLGLKLVEGRFYEDADQAPGRRLVVVDQSFARKFFPNGSAVGGRFTFGARPAKPEEWPVIIGVVKDVPHNGVEEKSGNPFIYQLLQPGGRLGGMSLFLRTNRSAAEAVSALRNKVRAIDPASPLFEVGVLQEAVDSSFDNRRAVMLLLATLAGLAMFLSALGIYGVLAYDVSQRTREIGVLSAIGASRGQISGQILKQGLWKGGIGVVLGLSGAALLSRSMTTLLFNVRPTDPAVYAAVSFVLIGVALLASYLPARRAARIDPLVALRDE
ncbi:MAG TPA: ABC transporter permease [Vicinamibacterales bacterium]|nr:ABC transporter permease [Vicinamibacterales bacterium]